MIGPLSPPLKRSTLFSSFIWTPFLRRCTNVSLGGSSPPPVDRVAADVAYFIARRHVGLVELPKEVDRTVDNAILSAGLRGRRLRLYSQRFLNHLKNLSKTRTHGGVVQFNEIQSRKLKQQKQKELNALIDASGTLQTALPDSNSPGSALAVHHVDNPGVQLERPKADYEEITTAAFAATRFPGCYASCIRIFDELKTRIPDFHPRRMLDFGAGLGTAIWAAQEVWDDSIHEVLAVEPSLPMIVLGKQIERARERSSKTKALIKWIPTLPTMYAIGKRTKRKYNFVVGSYVLSEILDTHERRRVIRQLWESCGEVLVLIEPGTPFGASNIQEARTMLLEYEKKKRRKLESCLNSGSGLDPMSERRLQSIGIHVVAPCPHDGPCPMEGKNMWCHFSQRFQTTRAQRVSSLNPESKFGPRDYQDEKYSYIVFKRGWRDQVENQDFQNLKISPQFYQQIKMDDPEKEWTPGKDRRIEKEQNFFQGKLDIDSSDLLEAPEIQELLQMFQMPVESGSKDLQDRRTVDEVQNKELSLASVRPWVMTENGDPSVRFPEHLSEIKHTDWETLDPEGLRSTRLAAKQWSRIIRHPRKRRGHIIVDVCSSTNADGSEGELQRHIVARSDREKVIGDAAYIMAKKAKWGDLWPSYYNRNHKITNP